jgi:carbonic anhydrase/acetyltransferase-like protein (isoleucine patch superfamily)
MPQIASSPSISVTAYIVGNVQIGETSSILPGAIIRGDLGRIVIGENTVVSDNCVIHTAEEMEISDNVVLGCGAVVHCRRIGNNLVVGASAVLLEESEIGEACIIAAGTLVMPGLTISDKSLIMGKVGGSDNGLLPLQLTGAHDIDKYAELARQFKADGL